jgi:hypothetical protein
MVIATKIEYIPLDSILRLPPGYSALSRTELLSVIGLVSRSYDLGANKLLERDEEADQRRPSSRLLHRDDIPKLRIRIP